MEVRLIHELHDFGFHRICITDKGTEEIGIIFSYTKDFQVSDLISIIEKHNVNFFHINIDSAPGRGWCLVNRQQSQPTYDLWTIDGRKTVEKNPLESMFGSLSIN